MHMSKKTQKGHRKPHGQNQVGPQSRGLGAFKRTRKMLASRSTGVQGQALRQQPLKRTLDVGEDKEVRDPRSGTGCG